MKLNLRFGLIIGPFFIAKTKYPCYSVLMSLTDLSGTFVELIDKIISGHQSKLE